MAKPIADENVLGLRPRDRHEAMLACELSLGDGVGDCVIIGNPPPAVLLGAAASAAGLTLFGTTRRIRDAVRLAEELTPVVASEARKDGDGLPDLDNVFGTALIWELPRREPEACLERALFALSDGGRVFVSLPRSGGADQRIERLVRGLCAEGVVRPPHAPPARLVLMGRRRSPIPEEMAVETPSPLPVSVIITAHGRLALLEDLLCDVLLRQNYPPLELFIMDDARPGEDSVPESLFGLPRSASCRTVIVPTGGVGKAAAINDALGGITGNFVAILDEGERIAPNHLATLGMALERHEEWAAVACDAAQIDETGKLTGFRPVAVVDSARPLRALLEGCPYCQPAAMFRSHRLREVRGFDPDLQRLADYDLWIRIAERGTIGVLPIPLAAVRRPSVATPTPDRTKITEEATRHILRGFRQRISIPRLMREFPEAAREEREATALVARGKASLRADLLEEAESDFRASQDVCPGFPAGEEGLLLALRRRGRHEETLAHAEKMAARRPKDPAPHLASATAYFHLGKRDAALQRLEGLLGGYPDLEVAHLNRIAMLMTDPRGEAALRAYLARRSGLRTIPYADHLLIAPRSPSDDLG